MCVVCFSFISKKAWDSKYSKKLPTDLTRKESGFIRRLLETNYSFDHMYVDIKHTHSPTAICATCREYVRRKRALSSSLQAKLRERVGGLPRASSASSCDGTECEVCQVVQNARTIAKKRFSTRSPMKMLPPVTRRKRRSSASSDAQRRLSTSSVNSPRSSTDVTTTAKTNTEEKKAPLPVVIPKLANAANAPLRSVSKMQKVWQQMLKEGEIDVKPPRGGVSLARKLRTFFQMDFENQDCNHTKDGTVVICPKVHRLVGKYLHFLGRHPDEAWRLKLNLDYGGDSLKTLLQILFDDDPLKTHDFSNMEHLSTAPDGNFDLLQSGVNGVLVILDAEGASESHEVVLDFLNRLSSGISKTRALLKVCVCEFSHF